uniref:Eukaryotic translation initiation factor 3 30 kDa subunit n=1 Tax=Parastrongyloides trichosuri TaxID=131310 RepID=A0A0N4ZKP6_PARTI
MSDWDCDDYEVDTSQISGKKKELGYEDDEIVSEVADLKINNKKTAPKETFSFKKTIKKELTPAEIKKKQEKSDRKLAVDLFGEDDSSSDEDDTPSDPLAFLDKLNVDNYKEFVSEFTERISTHSKEKFYKEMLGLLVGKMAEHLEDFQVNHMIKALQAIADKKVGSLPPKKQKVIKAAKQKTAKLLEDTCYDEYDEYGFDMD